MSRLVEQARVEKPGIAFAKRLAMVGDERDDRRIESTPAAQMIEQAAAQSTSGARSISSRSVPSSPACAERSTVVASASVRPFDRCSSR
jgi:hypothetical protein